ncbi:MAG: hypothetical protein IT426_11325 [Pirellulales bacterium]|nr:hypothetical protein [Pirellulales bacterium]
MLFCYLMLLLSAGGETTRFPEAAEVFRCRFDVGADKDFDTWPDDWTRRRGAGFPSYTKIGIRPEASPGGENCLRIDLDGGGAAVFSPPIPMDLSYGYVLEAYLRTEALKRDGAFVSLTFLDADKHTLSTARSEAITDSDGWKKIHLGTIETANPDARWIVVGLHVEPGDEADLHGAACFGDVWLGRLPKMELKTNHRQNFFVLPAKAEIACIASGLDGRFAEVVFELLDAAGESLAKETRSLTPQPSAAGQNRTAERDPSPAASAYAADWTPPLPGPGFYRIRLALKGSVATADRREITLAAVEPRLPPPHGIFGWSLPQGARPLTLPELADLLAQSGNGWVKYPLWCSEEDGGRQIEQIRRFADALGKAGIELAGLLLEPPEPAREKFAGTGPLTAAEVFGGDPKKWYPSLEPVIIQMSNKVRYWQLGRDTDLSLTVLPNFVDKIKAIRAQLDRAMQGIELGFGWDWMQNLPAGAEAADLPWNYVSISSDPPLTNRELETYLDAGRRSPLKPWVVIAPLPRDEFSPQTRAEDLVGRMVAAKVHGAAAAFCPDPFGSQRGLMNADGTPGDLLMPWRTTALEIGGAQFLGEMVLPRGSRNRVFVRENDAVMYVWNDRPAEEVLYLGDRVVQTDLWGQSADALELDGKQLLKIDRRPSFIAGINKSIARWSVDLQIENRRLSSVFGQTAPNGFSVQNAFPTAVTGKARIAAPAGWIVEPREFEFRLAPEEKLARKFDVNLPSEAASGRNTVRIDFEIQADRPYLFSVYRVLEVGTNDVRIEARTRLNERNELEIEQLFGNDSEKPVGFRCELIAPDRRRPTAQVRCPAHGEEKQVYRFENGESLLGKTLWLRAEEIDGPRILNYRFTAEK